MAHHFKVRTLLLKDPHFLFCLNSENFDDVGGEGAVGNSGHIKGAGFSGGLRRKRYFGKCHI